MAGTMTDMELYDKMPYNPEAEQSVLGAVLIAPDTLPEVMGIISADCFYRRENRELFSIMVAMFSSGEVIDPVTVLEGAVRGQQHTADYQPPLRRGVGAVVDGAEGNLRARAGVHGVQIVHQRLHGLVGVALRLLLRVP